MRSTDLPPKIDTPFAIDAGSNFVSTIPDAPGAPGRASWQTGFPPQNMQEIAAGGVPPFGQDMNGVFLAVSKWTRWQGAGGPVSWDSTFSTEVGGYPLGSVVTALNGLGWWVCLTEANTSNPDTSGTGWLFVPMEQSYAGNPTTHVAGQAGAPNVPPTTVFDTTNLIFWYCTATGSAAAATWAPVVSIEPVVLQAGVSVGYGAANVAKFYVRSNGGVAMTDALPNVGAVVNGWKVGVYNNDPAANLTITCSTQLNGVASGSLTLAPRQSTWFSCDASGNFWTVVPAIPQVFSGQAVYVNASGTYAPGVYDVDTSAGGITFQLELGGARGDNYFLRDVAGTFGSNPCLVDPNGRTIEGQTGVLPCDVPFTQFLLTRNQDTDYTLV